MTLVLDLGDFGLAAAKKLDAAALLPGYHNYAGGTPVYMAPELMKQGPSSKMKSSNTFKTDIYATGLTIWEVRSAILVPKSNSNRFRDSDVLS